MKQAIAMKCTQKNWDSIKDRIPEEIKTQIRSFDKNNVLVNNWEGMGIVSNCYPEHSRILKSEYFSTFNAKIFLEACGIDYESEYIITKLQLTQLLKNNEEGNEQLVSADLRAWFPDAFKKELETGKWYKSGYGAIIFCESFTSNNNIQGYGFNSRKEYVPSTIWFKIDKWQEATPQEVESALICEAKMRYPIGSIIKLITGKIDDISEKLNGEFFIEDNCVMAENMPDNYFTVFDNGKWATIIQPEKMTLEQIEKELGRKIELI